MIKTLEIEPKHIRNYFEKKILLLSGWEAEAFLWEAEKRATLLIRRQHELNQNLDYSQLQHALASFYFDRLDDIRYGLDYKVELRSRERFVTEDTFPNLFLFVVRIPGDKGFGLDRENHNNFGYHIHYVKVRSQRNQRTDIIFTFDPKEPPVPKPVLYWDQHHRTASVRINRRSFGRRRKMAIYDTCTPFLYKVQKSYFMTPSNSASQFYP